MTALTVRTTSSACYAELWWGNATRKTLNDVLPLAQEYKVTIYCRIDRWRCVRAGNGRQTVIWLLVGFASFVTLSAAGMAIAVAVIVRLPETYFSSRHAEQVSDSRPVRRWVRRILKNAAGVVVVISGIILSLPGIPGPGILTIMLGIMLMDFPRKRRLERWFISRPRVLAAVNRLRRQHGKPAFILEDQP